MIMRGDGFNENFEVIGGDQALGGIVHASFVPVTINSSNQSNFIVLDLG